MFFVFVLFGFIEFIILEGSSGLGRMRDFMGVLFVGFLWSRGVESFEFVV